MMWLKRLLRPLVPDRLMARYRLHQHSRQVRVNVDVLVAGGRNRRRWKATTPDTYRVGDSPGAGVPVPEFDRAEEDSGRHQMLVAGGGPAEAARVATALSVSAVDAVVLGRVARPRLVGRRRVEPPVDPVAVAVTRSRYDEVGGIPDGGDLVGLHRRLRDSGARFSLLPWVVPGPVDPQRRDFIDAPAVVVLAGVPLHDVGGGSRGAQLTLELVRRGFHVVYVALFGTHESTDLGLRFIHPRLEQWQLTEFEAGALAGRVARPGLVLVEMPAAGFLPAVESLQGKGWRVCYDIIDRWSDPSLGGEWYRPDIEDRFVSTADLVAASAPDLLPDAPGVTSVLVPNAVSAAVFGRDPGPRPDDLPSGDGPIIGYHGSLYGDWFDWVALRGVAVAHPRARVVLIGDVPGHRPEMPPNVHFLGLKTQGDLPGYVSRFDVGLVPFVVSDTTHAVSPLKVFEYLACGVPVAATPLRSVEGLEGVTADPVLEVAVARALRADRPDGRAVLAEHSWSRRVEDLVAAADLDGPVSPGSPVIVERRPVRRYGRRERSIRAHSASAVAQPPGQANLRP